MKRFVLIDGNAILHRAFHALPPLTSPDGMVVNAVYGFTTMLLKLITDLKPAYVAVAFDRPAPTFRKQLYTEYQATRPKMDDDLIPQVGKLHELLAAFGIAMFEQDGFEADDVIGTLATKAVAAKDGPDQTIIVTGDRDILQLVEDERVLAYMPVKGLTEAKLYGEKEVKERLGVPPREVADYKALAGDSSDNYPGVTGIGPKTAAQLVGQFQTVEKLYAALRAGTPLSIPEKARERLIAGEESAMLSKNLATIRRDVPIDVDWQAVALHDLATDKAKEMLHELHFHSLLKRLEHPAEKQHASRGKQKTAEKSADTSKEQLPLI